MGDNAEIIERRMQVAREFVAWVRERLGDSLLAARVFGSVARGDATDESDVDVFLLLARRLTADERLELGGETFDLLMESGIYVQWVGETRERWRMPVIHGSGLARAVREEGLAV